MHSEARDAYLENRVLTAPPQRLRLMLIEGALRFSRQTLLHWERGEHDAGLAALGRARSIVTELMSSIQPDGSPLSRQVAAIYLFLYRALAEAAIDRNSQQVREAIEVLAIEHETWRLVCEQVPPRESRGTAAGDAYQSTAEQRPFGAGTAGAAAPPMRNLALDDAASHGGLLLDA